MEPLPDIPLEKAIIVWNPEVTEVDPALDGRIEVISAAGCCSVPNGFTKIWKPGSKEELLPMLWRIAVSDWIPASQIHDSLNVIPEYRELTKDYQIAGI